MFWQENEEEQESITATDVVDVVFDIECRALPVEHAYVLSSAIQNVLEWFDSEPLAGLHLIHGAESGNGWMRPASTGDDILYVSKRTRLVLRVPLSRVEEAKSSLIGQVLTLGEFSIRVERAKTRPLSKLTTLFSRYVVEVDGSSEHDFLTRSHQQLLDLGIQPKKLMAGRMNQLVFPDKIWHTRSLMVAELSGVESILLQRSGLGSGRHVGCGIFVPQKDIKEVSAV